MRADVHTPLGDHRRPAVAVDPSTTLACQQSQTLIAFFRETMCTGSERILRSTAVASNDAGWPESLRIGSRSGGGRERLQDGRLRRRRGEGSAGAALRVHRAVSEQRLCDLQVLADVRGVRVQRGGVLEAALGSA